MDETDGTAIYSYYFSGTAYNHIFDKDYVRKEALPVILAAGYQKVVLDSKLYPNGYWGESSKDADTDRDGLSDWDEVKTELLHINGIGDYELPTVGECVQKLDKIPFYVEDALSRSDVIRSYWYQTILPINSDPTQEDSDGDGLCDKCDDAKLFYKGIPQQLHNLTTKQTISCCNLKFTDDGFIYVGDSLSNMLDTLEIPNNNFHYYEDWHLFCVSSDEATHFGLCKLRPHTDTKKASFAVSFCYFDLKEFNAFCEKKIRKSSNLFLMIILN